MPVLTVHHHGVHVAGSPDRCRCHERRRLAAGGTDLEPIDRHTFVSSTIRDRYVRECVDPACRVERDGVDVEWVETVHRIAADVVSGLGRGEA